MPTLTPLQFTRLALLTLLLYTLWLPFFLFSGHRLPRSSMLLLLLPLLLVLSLEIWCESSLSKGLRNDRWPPAQVEAARAWVGLPFYDWIIRLGVAFCVVLFLFSVRSGHISGAISMLYFPLIASTNLKRIFHPPTTASGSRTDWRQSAPIFSEHWGEPPQTHS